MIAQKQAAGSRARRGRLLVILPALPISPEGRGHGPTHVLLRELAKDRELMLVALRSPEPERAYMRALGCQSDARSGQDMDWARIKTAVSGHDHEAILVLDHEATRGHIAPLHDFSCKPVIHILLERSAPWDPPVPGDGRGAIPGRWREEIARQACLASEVWSQAAESDMPPAPTRAVPAGLVCGMRLERDWLRQRLRRVISGCGRYSAPASLTSIIIPFGHGARRARECLGGVLRCTTAPHEIILTGAGWRAIAAGLRGRGRRVRCLAGRRDPSFAEGINQGMRLARGEQAVWLAPDVSVTPRWLERLTACARRAPWIGAVGPCSNAAEGGQGVGAAGYQDTRKGLRAFSEAWALRHDRQLLQLPSLDGFCMLVKRAAWAQVGGLDERLGEGGYEAYDYSFRLRQAGYCPVCALDVFVHRSRSGELRARSGREALLDKWYRQTLGFIEDLDAR